MELPAHLRTLARIAGHEVTLDVEARRPRSPALWTRWRKPTRCSGGTIRDHVTRERRAFLRFFACQQDISLEPPDTPLPPAIVNGSEPLRVRGAVAGG